MAGPGTAAPKESRSARMTLPEMKRVMHSMAMVLLHQANRITLADDVFNSHSDVVLSALAGVMREDSNGPSSSA